jgi:hypothetical protein
LWLSIKGKQQVLRNDDAFPSHITESRTALPIDNFYIGKKKTARMEALSGS